MESESWESPLCLTCRSITFDMLATNFDHSLPYKQTVESGKTCKFCRLMVCSFSKLQVHENMYEVDRNYDTWVQLLPKLPYVIRSPGLVLPHNTPIEKLETPKHLRWTRNGATEAPYLNGYFNEGATIQISTPTYSAYHELGLLTTHDIEAANSRRNTATLYNWLRNCIKEHPECRQSFSGENFQLDEHLNEVHPLPTRIIDVGLNNESVKLLASAGRTGMYTTLSHRWGARGNVVQTLSKNLPSHLNSIQFDGLPQTFKDAIEVTRSLGLKYLWVDSICIVQDDEVDWNREAAQMGAIFEHSCCTIAAIDAIDDESGEDRGLFLPRIDDPLTVRMSCAFSKIPVMGHAPEAQPTEAKPYGWVYCYLPNAEGRLYEEPGDEHKRHRIVARPRLLSGPWAVLRSKWNQRGWVLQERILSRRIIYYTMHKLFWDCNSHSGEEEQLGIGSTPVRASYLAQVRSSWSWEGLVNDYTQCQLTYNWDKLNAICGLFDRLERRVQRKCHSGIFEDETGQCLLWRAKSTDPLIRYRDFHAPSWAWAAYKGSITYSTHDIAPSTVIPLISTPAFHCQRRCLRSGCTNPKSACVSGSASFSGPVGVAFRSGCLETWRFEDRDLIPILGSAVHLEGKPVPRIIDGVLTASKRELSLPDRSEILTDASGSIIGWVLLDTDDVGRYDVQIVCAAVRLWRRSGPLSAVFGSVDSFDYMNEENVDILALQIRKEHSDTYERIGRGRIVKKGWLTTLDKKEFVIW